MAAQNTRDVLITAIAPPVVNGLRLIRQLESHTLNSFDGFGLAEPIARALVQESYVTPTPISHFAFLLLALCVFVGMELIE